MLATNGVPAINSTTNGFHTTAAADGAIKAKNEVRAGANATMGMDIAFVMKDAGRGSVPATGATCMRLPF